MENTLLRTLGTGTLCGYQTCKISSNSSCAHVQAVQGGSWSPNVNWNFQQWPQPLKGGDRWRITPKSQPCIQRGPAFVLHTHRLPEAQSGPLLMPNEARLPTITLYSSATLHIRGYGWEATQPRNHTVFFTGLVPHWSLRVVYTNPTISSREYEGSKENKNRHSPSSVQVNRKL